MEDFNTMENGILYGVGVGPGGEELLTLKAVEVIKNVDVIIAPSAKESGESIAYETAKNFIN
ncbi:MAG: precorrin-2 C(20)-methyltransferase, partial [Methanobrevibacter sp.]|nr:precorrin-2 C(20)-methyltransferase [Methanobrevibacter sp.]